VGGKLAFFFVFLLGFTENINASTENLISLLEKIKQAKNNQFQYKPCNAELEEYVLYLDFHRDKWTSETHNIYLPKGFLSEDKFCGKWSSEGDHPLQGWRRDEVMISLNPDTSDSNLYLVFKTDSSGDVKLVNYSGGGLVGSFRLESPKN